MVAKKFGIGQPIRRVEDQRLLTGGGRYVDDVSPAETLHGVVLRSAHTHARFKFADLETARAMPGVRLILTAPDVTGLGDVPCLAPLANGDGSQGHVAHIPVLAKGVVKHVGDAIAFVVADTAALARDAADAIAVDYEPLPAAVDLRQAVEAGAPSVWNEQPGNVAVSLSIGEEAEVDAIFRTAHKVVSITIENNRLVTNYMETRGAIGEYDGETQGFRLTSTSQGVHGQRDTLAKHIFRVEPDKVQVVTGDVGGGFGTKSFTYREYALVLEAARRLRRPVKWVADRGDHFVSDAHGRDNVSKAEVACDASGRFLAMRFDVLANLGAYLSQYGPYIPYLGITMLTGVYKTPKIFARLRAAYTNTTPVDAYRGAGRPEAAYLLERLVDRAARELGKTPDDLRRINFIPVAEMPYTTPIGDRTYDTGDFDQHMTQAMAVADWGGFETRLKASRASGTLRGIGLATYIECTAWGEGEDVQVRLETDGTVTVYSGTQSNGQGHATAYAQFAAHHLDLPLDRIRVVQGDTAQVRTGHGTGGSRSIPVGGVATHVAASKLAEKLKALAGAHLEAGVDDLEIADGAVRVAGTDRVVTLEALAQLPTATPDARTGEAGFVPPAATYPNGTHVAEVEIDPETGVTSIARYTICDDFGIAVNPLLLAGQVHGGVAQGVGQALHERTVYDADGQLVTASFMDYCLPRAGDLPLFHFETKNVPSTTNPLGIKGAGEAGSIGSCPAIMNAMVDALDRAYGVRDLDMPATPARVFSAISAARQTAA